MSYRNEDMDLREDEDERDQKFSAQFRKFTILIVCLALLATTDSTLRRRGQSLLEVVQKAIPTKTAL